LGYKLTLEFSHSAINLRCDGIFPSGRGHRMKNSSIVLGIMISQLAVNFAHAADRGAVVSAGGVTGLDLKTQLQKGLRARRPVEFEYIDEIIALVDSGQLPRPLVTTTFVWAQKQPTRQLQYFQFALQTRAKGLAVQLPDLRKQAVGIGGNGGEHGVTTP
jgi:hypothetical protein